MLKFKDQSILQAGDPQAALSDALVVVERVYEWFGIADVTVTAIRNGTHMAGSLHPRGYAADIRTNDLKQALVPAIAATLKAQLGPAYDVALESDSTPGASAQHLHIEFDPQHDGGKNIP